MKLYEIVNSSDCVTFEAPDDATAEELQEYRAQVEDRNRSSVSNIVGRAWVLGRALRRQE